MKKIAASILGIEDKKNLINKLIFNDIQMIHYDVMDGNFVNNFSLPVEEVRELVGTTLPHIVDVHLMVSFPEKYILNLKDIANYITIHYEAESIDSLYELFRQYPQLKIGLAINPQTKVDLIFEFLPYVSHILVMSVAPGKGGQSFIENSLDKIKKLKNRITQNNHNVLIQVDGGINNIIARHCFQAGADSLVSGSYLINNMEDHGLFPEK